MYGSLGHRSDQPCHTDTSNWVVGCWCSLAVCWKNAWWYRDTRFGWQRVALLAHKVLPDAWRGAVTMNLTRLVIHSWLDFMFTRAVKMYLLNTMAMLSLRTMGYNGQDEGNQWWPSRLAFGAEESLAPLSFNRSQSLFSRNKTLEKASLVCDCSNQIKRWSMKNS